MMTRNDAKISTLWRIAFALAAGACSAAIAGLAAGQAGAVTGNAGPVRITAEPTSRVADGQAVSIHAQAPSGIAIYELRAHLCSAGPPITTNWAFGFQGGRRCANVALGHGDTEKIAAFPAGTTSAILSTFHVGVGSAHWVDDLGYDQIISCGPAHPCDLVVRAEITNDVVFATLPLCYGASCSAEPDTVPTVPTTVLVLPQAVRPPPATSVAAPPPAAAPRSRAAAPRGNSARAAKVSTAARPAPRALNATKEARSARTTPPVQPATAPSSPAHALTRRERVVLSALASGLAGAWIVAILLRGDALVLHRRRAFRTA